MVPNVWDFLLNPFFLILLALTVGTFGPMLYSILKTYETERGSGSTSHGSD